MKHFITKIAIATTLCSGLVTVANITSPPLNADAKTFKLNFKSTETYDKYASSDFIEPFYSNTCFVYNSKKKLELLSFTSPLIKMQDKNGNPKKVKNMTILLSNGKKAYIKNGKLYSNSKKLYNGKISSKTTKIWSYDNKKKIGYALQSFEVNVKNGKINVKTLKIHNALYGDVGLPG